MRLRVIFNNIPQKEIHLIYHCCYYHYYEVMLIEGREENMLKAKDKYHRISLICVIKKQNKTNGQT